VRTFLLSVCEGHCLCASTRRESPDFRNCITAAVALVDRDMLTRVWNEMDYRIDVSAVLPKVDTLSICEICKKLGEFLSLSA